MARVSDILRGKGTDVLKIEASATVFAALEKLVEKNVGSILVTDGGEVVGIMTERDYLRKIAVLGRTSHDTKVSEGNRIVQLTPAGSGCSIVVGEGIVPDMAPGSLKGLQLVVADLHAARAQLAQRGVEVSEIQVMGESPTPQPDPLDNVGFVFFSDPDGNGWAVQQISARGA